MHRTTRHLLIITLLASMMLVVFGCTKKPPVVPTERPPRDTTAIVKPKPKPEPEPVKPAPVDTFDTMADKEVEPEIVEPEPTPPPELKVVYFDFDQSSFTNQALRQLKENAVILQQYPEWRVIIEGHCDERGSTEYNLALGERRANAVYRYYMNFGGINKEMFAEIISYGEEKPVSFGHDEGAWAKNRRSITRRK